MFVRWSADELCFDPRGCRPQPGQAGGGTIVRHAASPRRRFIAASHITTSSRCRTRPHLPPELMLSAARPAKFVGWVERRPMVSSGVVDPGGEGRWCERAEQGHTYQRSHAASPPHARPSHTAPPRARGTNPEANKLSLLSGLKSALRKCDSKNQNAALH